MDQSQSKELLDSLSIFKDNRNMFVFNDPYILSNAYISTCLNYVKDTITSKYGDNLPTQKVMLEQVYLYQALMYRFPI